MRNLLTDREMDKFLLQVVSGAGGGGITEDEVSKALDKMHEWIFYSAILELWKKDYLAVSWDSSSDDFIISLADSVKAAEQ